MHRVPAHRMKDAPADKNPFTISAISRYERGYRRNTVQGEHE
jgi:hypothetical protein